MASHRKILLKNVSLIVILYKFDSYSSTWLVDLQAITEIEDDEDDNCAIYIKMQSHVVNCLMFQLHVSKNYRCRILRLFRKYLKTSGARTLPLKEKVIRITVNAVPDVKEVLDKEWGWRLNLLAHERLQLDTVMCYLSTLGGAFSALGDHHSHCAKTAGVISWQQFQIALRLGEEPLAARCRLYMALSMIQQGKLKAAKRLILSQFHIAKAIEDTRLQNMCKGIWAKLQYTRRITMKAEE